MFGNAIAQTNSPGGRRRGLIWQSGGGVQKRVRVLHLGFISITEGGPASGLEIPGSFGGIWDSSYQDFNYNQCDWVYDDARKAFQYATVTNTYNPTTGKYEQSINSLHNYYIKPFIYVYSTNPTYYEYIWVHNSIDESTDDFTTSWLKLEPVSNRCSYATVQGPDTVFSYFAYGQQIPSLWATSYQYFAKGKGMYKIPLYDGNVSGITSPHLTGEVTIFKADLRWAATDRDTGTIDILKFFNCLVYKDATILINGSMPPTP